METKKWGIDLVQGQRFELCFKISRLDANNESERIVAKCQVELPIKDKDSLIKQVKVHNEFDYGLKSSIAKTSADVFCRQIIHVSLGITTYGVQTPAPHSATIKLAISGEFFDDFLSDFKQPVKLRLKMDIECEDEQVLNLVSKEMSPSVVLIVEKGYFLNEFKDELKLQAKKIFNTNQTYFGRITLEMIPFKTVDLTNLPCKISMCKNILESEIEADFEIISENGVRFKCHKVFLAANSPVLAELLRMDCKEMTEKAIQLNLSETGVKAFLKFIYHADVDEPMKMPSVALELLEFGEEKDITDLMQVMKDILLLQDIEWYDINTAILLYLRTLKLNGNRDLMWRAIQVIKSKPDDLIESHVYKKLSQDDFSTATRMISICLHI